MTSFTIEAMKDCRADVEALIPAQWAETGDIGLDCKPLWEMYEALEKAGALVTVMARRDGEAIGYLTGTISVHPNSRGEKVASFPTYFVKRMPGRALVLKGLIEHAAAAAWERGVWKVSVKTEYAHSAGRLLEALGMMPAATEYVLKRPMREAKYA